jgi:predicted transcriptional regulator
MSEFTALISAIVRNRGDIVAAIPEAINGGTSKTKIMYKAYYFSSVHIKGISIHTD